MQSNSPAPVQRNRRAGRLSPAEPTDVIVPQNLSAQPQPFQAPPARPLQTVQPVQNLQPLYPTVPTPAQTAAPSAPAPVTGAPAASAYPRRSAAPTQPSVQTYPPQTATYQAAPAQYAYDRPQGAAPAPTYRSAAYPRPDTQTPVQPTARRTAAAPVPTQTRSVPAGSRPQAAPMPARMRQDDPDARRAAAKAARLAPPPERVEKTSAKPRKDKPIRQTTPSWLRSLLSLMLVGVLALVAAAAVMMATLKTKADEQQQARENMLYNYHLTEQADGALRVTWQELIEHYAAMYNLDPAFVTAVIRNESSFRTDAVSSVGARGLMQMMPDTAEWIAGKLDERYDFDLLFEAETAIRYGCWYLGYLADLFGGDTVLVCAAYHAGQGEVLGWLGDPAISPDGVTVPIRNIPITNTRTYAERVTKAYGVYDALLYPVEPAQAPDVPGALGAAADSMPLR